MGSVRMSLRLWTCSDALRVRQETVKKDANHAIRDSTC
jgi:hypothetical protein